MLQIDQKKEFCLQTSSVWFRTLICTSNQDFKESLLLLDVLFAICRVQRLTLWPIHKMFGMKMPFDIRSSIKRYVKKLVKVSAFNGSVSI